MHYSVLAAFVLVVASLAIAGCTQNPVPAATPVTIVPTGTPVATATATAVVPQPSFSLGDHYLQRSYSFHGEKDPTTEQFRVDDPAWGIDLAITPLNDDPQACWFQMTVTNVDNGRTDTYGYGRTYDYNTHQQVPMYTTGPYKIEMTGNLVRVVVTAAKRNP